MLHELQRVRASLGASLYCVGSFRVELESLFALLKSEIIVPSRNLDSRLLSGSTCSSVLCFARMLIRGLNRGTGSDLANWCFSLSVDRFTLAVFMFVFVRANLQIVSDAAAGTCEPVTAYRHLSFVAGSGVRCRALAQKVLFIEIQGAI